MLLEIRESEVGRFVSSSCKKNAKKSLPHKYKYIKNTTATGIAQKNYKALFLLWSLTPTMWSLILTIADNNMQHFVQYSQYMHLNDVN